MRLSYKLKSIQQALQVQHIRLFCKYIIKLMWTKLDNIIFAKNRLFWLSQVFLNYIEQTINGTLAW